MYISTSKGSDVVDSLSDDENNESPEHAALSQRLQKTLYYGRQPGTDRPSMPLTELAVGYFRDVAPKRLGRVDMHFASGVGRKAYASSCSLMVGMMYARRLRTKNPEYLQQVSSSDLFLISMLVASKYMYDEGTDDEVYNDEWADAADMETQDINELETEFLQAIDWSLFVGQDEFSEMLNAVEARIAGDTGWQRGFFTYTDLSIMAQQLEMMKTINQLLKEISKVMLVCSMAYCAGSLMLAASPAALHAARSCLPSQPARHPLLKPSTPTNPTVEEVVRGDDLSKTNKERANETDPTWTRKRSESVQKMDSTWKEEGSISMMTNLAQDTIKLVSLVALAIVETAKATFPAVHSDVASPVTDHFQSLFPNEMSSRLQWLCNCGACVSDNGKCRNVSSSPSSEISGGFRHSSLMTSCSCRTKRTSNHAHSLDSEESWKSIRSCQAEDVCCCCPPNLVPSVHSPFSDFAQGFQTAAAA